MQRRRKTIKALKARWADFTASRRGRLTLRVMNGGFVLGITAYLAYKLTQIGWVETWEALPTHPLFYLLFGALYFLLPTAEIILYRITWTFNAWKSFAAFVKKRIYNNEVLGYSGEFYFYTWARKHVGLSDLDILKTIRDQNIVSSLASNLIAALLVVIFLLTGEKNVTEWIGRQDTAYLIGGGVVGAVLLALGIRLRRYLFSMTFKTAALSFTVHVVRLIIGQGLQIAMWAVAMPDAPLPVWFTYAALSIVITRIPLIPNRDLIFVAAGIGLSSQLQISAAGVASMLVAIAVLGKVLNLFFYTGLSLLARRTPDTAPAVEPRPRPAGPRPRPAELLPVAEPEEVM